MVGVFLAKDYWLRDDGKQFTLREYLREPLYIPSTRAAERVLDDLRKTRAHLAVVLDEYGGTAGIVTIEDLVEALVGRIDDEPPAGAANLLTGPEQPAGDGSLVLDGLMRLDELQEQTGIRVDAADHELVETVGGPSGASGIP